MNRKIAKPFSLRLWRDHRAVTAIEFALVGPIFILLIVVIAELGLYYGKQASLDFAVQNGARVLRVGYVDGVRTNQINFEEAMCDRALFVDCGDLSYSVEARPSLTSADYDPELNTDGELTGAVFQVGGPAEIVIITAAAIYDFVTPLGTWFFGDPTGNGTPIFAHIIIKNEPFPL